MPTKEELRVALDNAFNAFDIAWKTASDAEKALEVALAAWNKKWETK